MEATALAARKLAVGLARFVIQNEEKVLEGEQISAIIYRLRVVESFAAEDVDLICEAMRHLILRLVKLPPITFAPEVWMPIMAAVSEGGLEPQWVAMVESLDVKELAENYMEPDPHPVPPMTNAKSYEHITSISMQYVLELGLTRRLLSSLWGCDLTEIAGKMEDIQNLEEKDDSLKILTTMDSINSTSALMEKSVFDSFAKMTDNNQLAKEIFYCALARILKKLIEHKSKPPSEKLSEADHQYIDSAFALFDEILKRMWPYLYKDTSLKRNTLLIFDKLLGLSPADLLTQKIADKMKDACDWLQIAAEEVCAEIEDRLWKVVFTLVAKFVELKKSIPYEIDILLEDDYPDDFEAQCEQLPSNNKEKFLRFMVDSTRATLISILRYLPGAKTVENMVKFMKDWFSELFQLYSSKETLICDAAVCVYREFHKRNEIIPVDETSIASNVIVTPAIVAMPYLIQVSTNIENCKSLVHRLLCTMALDLEERQDKRDYLAKQIDSNGVFWDVVTKYADKEMLAQMAKRLVPIASYGPKNINYLACNIFLSILKLDLASESQPETEPICNFTFKDLEVDEKVWNALGRRLVEVNMEERRQYPVPIYTLQQLTDVNLPFLELLYAFFNVWYLKSEEGLATHRKFYEGHEKFEAILEKFMGREHLVLLSARLLEEFAKVIVTNESNLIFSLEHENIMDWLFALGVQDHPLIAIRLVQLCKAVEAWDCLMLLQLDINECSAFDLKTFARFWGTFVMKELPKRDQKSIENDMCGILGAQWEKQTVLAKKTRESRFKGMFPTRPKVDQWEDQLMLMHNRVASYISTKKVEDFADEASELNDWLIIVCSGQNSYTPETVSNAKRILARLYPEAEKRKEILWHRGVQNVLYGLSNAHKEGVLYRQLRNYFIKIYMLIIRWDMKKNWKEDDDITVTDRRLGGLRVWLRDTVRRRESETEKGMHMVFLKRLADTFMTRKNEIDLILSTNATPTEVETLTKDLIPIRLFAEVVASEIDAVADWLLPSTEPYVYPKQMRTIVELIHTFPQTAHRHHQPIELLFRKLFAQLFHPDHQTMLLKHEFFRVQHTDKYLASSLNHHNDYCPNKKNLYQVREILSIFSEFGSEQIQLECLGKIEEELKKLPDAIMKHIDILRGRTSVHTEEQKRIVCHVTLLSECLGYVNRLQMVLNKKTEDAEQKKNQEDDVLKAFMLLDSDVHSKMEKSEESQVQRQNKPDRLDLNYCTFKTTNNSFTSQHWYNCYTCNMDDTIGVCSVCAVNCHRGHELAYSKKGPFFCDCGEKGCAAMQGVRYVPDAMASLRGQFPDKNVVNSIPVTREIFTFCFENLESENLTQMDQLKEALGKIKVEFDNQKEKIMTILEAVAQGNKKALEITEKRAAVLSTVSRLNASHLKDARFMSPLESGHFFPVRRIDALPQNSGNPKIRDLADVIKLDNGTELLVMIPESISSCIQLHYMDTRTNLLQGMFSLRTEVEIIPFSPRRLHVSGNRAVVCGTHEIYALRFSPQGTVIDRAHIKLLEHEKPPSSSSVQANPVVKAVFCKDSTKKKQLIAVATLQYVRVYDLTLHEKAFVEEMVLTAGNVQDVVMLVDEPTGRIRVIVLSNSGYLYEHIITNGAADSNSYFLTNVVNLPDVTGDGMTLYYSHTFNLLFASFHFQTYFASLPALTEDRNDNETAIPRYEWVGLSLGHPIHVWREAAGILGGLSTVDSTTGFFFHPTAHHLLVQKFAVDRQMLTFYLTPSAKNQSIYSVFLYSEIPTCEIWETNWNNVHDLWIEDVPSERFMIEMVGKKNQPVALPIEDLVLMAENCEPLATVDWTCKDLEMFYTHAELNQRLSSPDHMPIVAVQQTRFTLSARITNSRQVVRMIRIEVDGPTGPEAIKINGFRYNIATRRQKSFDLRLSREESISADHRDITIEIIPRATQNTVKIIKLKLYGCDRSAMDEVQPLYERAPIMTLPNRLAYAVVEYSKLRGADDWTEELAKRHLNRRVNHPAVCAAATKAIASCFPLADEKLFETIDDEYLREWKELKNWTEEKGYAELRTIYVEQLLDRLESVHTRWRQFSAAMIRQFESATAFVKVMRDEMTKMPLHRCQMMAHAIVKITFGLLADGLITENDELISCFLDIFTDETTSHLANDMRSAVQETIWRLESVIKEEKAIMAKGFVGENENIKRIANGAICAFYGTPRLLKDTPENRLILKNSGTIPISTAENMEWLEQIVSKIIEKLKIDKTPVSVSMQISDSPSYNLAKVLTSCLAICAPEVIGAQFKNILKLLNYEKDTLYPLQEDGRVYPSYSLFRSVELLLSVCLEKRAEEKDKQPKPYTNMLSGIVTELQTCGIKDFCYNVMVALIPHWRMNGPSTIPKSAVEVRKVWLPHVPLVSSSANPPNTTVHSEYTAFEEAWGNAESKYMFFGRNWPSNRADAHTIAVTDLILLLSLHLHEAEKRKSQSKDDKWIQQLCQLAALTSGCSAYRQCKKLLLVMCHNDEAKYRIMRDMYKMQDLLNQLVWQYISVSKEVGGHQQLTELVDVLVSITKLAIMRPDMWRDVCSAYTEWLLRLACYTTDCVASQVIELLIVAVRDTSAGGQVSIQHLADSIIETKNGEFIEKIIKRFLIGKDEMLRWTMHGMLRSVIQLANRQNQCLLVKKLYKDVYPLVENLGIQGAQLVDLIAAYAPRYFSSSEITKLAQTEVKRIQQIDKTLEADGYLGMYKQMMEIGLGWKSIQFDRNPCLVCYPSKGSHDNVKLQSIKADTRYSPHVIIYKLISNYEISKVTIKMTEVKRTKSVKKANLYYCAKSADPVELKLHPEMWRKCASVNVGENDTTITLSLAVPVVTSSLIIEFDEVVDLTTGSSQLHCPRCSGPVKAQSGICESCGENAFQCMKCRAINYVGKEPFLCQSCGFCKFARIEMFAQCRALPGAQHITCDTERAQCLTEMAQLLTKIESTKSKLSGFRALCETLYMKSRPIAMYKLHVENNHVSEFFTANGVMNSDSIPFQSVTLPMNNLAIAIRSLHSELCQQTQQLIYLHEELNRYDNASEVSVVFHRSQNTEYYSTSETCFGCLCNQFLHSIAILHSVCDHDNSLVNVIYGAGLVERLGIIAQNFEPLREELEELLVRLMYGRSDVTSHVEKLIQAGDMNLSVIVKSLTYAADPIWQQKMKALLRITVEWKDESSALQTLMVLHKTIEATKHLPSDEKKKLKLTKKDAITKWLTTDKDWVDCCNPRPSTSKAPPPPQLPLNNAFQWISSCLFSQWMTVRAAAGTLLVTISKQQFHEPVALLMLCENLAKLDDVPTNVCGQFMNSAHVIIDSSINVKARLFVQQFHVYLIRRIHEECSRLHAQKVSLIADNTFGEKLRCFVELLVLLLSGSSIENVLLKAGADDLLIFLLHSTIFLKRMMTRRTRAIDSSRMALEKLLRRVSARDGSKLLNVCVESLKLVKDTSTLGIIVGVMMEIMNPTQEPEDPFLIQIEKDVAQEDYLQGRMSQNPYSSTDVGMGPLMRDIKNRICRDTEMMGLADDDNGMELVVNGNIVALSLTVREVYEKLWKRTNGSAPMLIVYRMRGLNGDAVETFIENFGLADDSKEKEDEQLVRIVESLVTCGGLDKLMDLLTNGIETAPGRFLLGYLRKIFERIVKTSVGRKGFVERRGLEKMMSVIRNCCIDPTNDSKVQIGLDLYKIMEIVVCDPLVQDSLCGIQEEDALWWFEMFERRNGTDWQFTEGSRKEALFLDQTAANLGNILIGSDASEQVLVDVFEKTLNWTILDTPSEENKQRYERNFDPRRPATVKERTLQKTEQLALITSNIFPSESGRRLKQKILDSGVIEKTCQHLLKDLPNLLGIAESSEWQTYLTRPSLKMILTIFAGLAKGHQATQKEIAKTTLKLMHRLEQVASSQSIGSLAESVIDALSEDPEVKLQITQVREETKRKKKQMAMANRTKQLNKLGMKVNTSGEVVVGARVLHNEPSVEETDSMACCICRESVIREARPAGVYAFAAIDPDTAHTGTVSMMVMVHLECHKNALRGASGGRAADEWTRAKLHNAGARCNVITPISLGLSNDIDWHEITHRFESDLGRVAGLARSMVNRNFVFLDMCKLVDLFIHKRSFSTQSEGGGRESNMQYFAILHLLGCFYPATDSFPLDSSTSIYRLIQFLFTELTVAGWNEEKADVLRASLNDATMNGAASTWDGLKDTLLTWAFVDTYFNKVIPIDGDDRLDWLRVHIADTISKTTQFVDNFDTNILPCEDAAEFCDVTGVPLEDVNMFLGAPAPQNPPTPEPPAPENAPENAPQE